MNKKLTKAVELLEQGYGYWCYSADHSRLVYRPVRVGFDKYKAICGWLAQDGVEHRVSIEEVHLEPLHSAEPAYHYENE